MKCKEFTEIMLSLAIDQRLDRISVDCKSHLETCTHCQQEWSKIQNWVHVLRTQEEWTPDDAFIQSLTEQSMREKRRPFVSESTWKNLNLGGTKKRWFDWLFRFPKTAITASVALVLILVFGEMAIRIFDVIGNFDYISGNVLVQSNSVENIETGSKITKGMSIQTAKGSQSVLALRDGSEILLSSLSRISLDDTRAIRLERGTAFFEVEKGKGQFHVHVPNGEILVLGTSFSVTVEQGTCTVTVVEGVVQCSNNQKTIRVHPGYDGVMTGHKAPELRHSARVQQTISWVTEIKKKRDSQELRTYYPSLSGPEGNDTP